MSWGRGYDSNQMGMHDDRMGMHDDGIGMHEDRMGPSSGGMLESKIAQVLTNMIGGAMNRGAGHDMPMDDGGYSGGYRGPVMREDRGDFRGGFRGRNISRRGRGRDRSWDADDFNRKRRRMSQGPYPPPHRTRGSDKSRRGSSAKIPGKFGGFKPGKGYQGRSVGNRGTSSSNKTDDSKNRRKRKIAVFDSDAYCEACDKIFPGAKALDSHTTGFRHKQNQSKLPSNRDKIILVHKCRLCGTEIKEWMLHKQSTLHKINQLKRNLEKSTDPYIRVDEDTEEPEGVEYVAQVTGYYCRLCKRFYTEEEAAKVKHCKTKDHVEKSRKDQHRKKQEAELRELMAKLDEEKEKEREDEGVDDEEKEDEDTKQESEEEVNGDEEMNEVEDEEEREETDMHNESEEKVTEVDKDEEVNKGKDVEILSDDNKDEDDKNESEVEDEVSLIVKDSVDDADIEPSDTRTRRSRNTEQATPTKNTRARKSSKPEATPEKTDDEKNTEEGDDDDQPKSDVEETDLSIVKSDEDEDEENSKKSEDVKKTPTRARRRKVTK